MARREILISETLRQQLEDQLDELDALLILAATQLGSGSPILERLRRVHAAMSGLAAGPAVGRPVGSARVKGVDREEA